VPVDGLGELRIPVPKHFLHDARGTPERRNSVAVVCRRGNPRDTSVGGHIAGAPERRGQVVGIAPVDHRDVGTALPPALPFALSRTRTLRCCSRRVSATTAPTGPVAPATTEWPRLTSPHGPSQRPRPGAAVPDGPMR
jgi:hypothetical protein